MDGEKVTIIGGYKFFVRSDGSSGIVPNDETKEEKIKTASELGTKMHDKIASEIGTKLQGVICTKTKLTDEEAADVIDKYGAQMRFYGMVNEISRLEDGLKNIKQHIKTKIGNSALCDWGISDKLSDRLFTETVVELQLIEQMIDDILEGKDE